MAEMIRENSKRKPLTRVVTVHETTARHDKLKKAAFIKQTEILAKQASSASDISKRMIAFEILLTYLKQATDQSDESSAIFEESPYWEPYINVLLASFCKDPEGFKKTMVQPERWVSFLPLMPALLQYLSNHFHDGSVTALFGLFGQQNPSLEEIENGLALYRNLFDNFCYGLMLLYYTQQGNFQGLEGPILSMTYNKMLPLELVDALLAWLEKFPEPLKIANIVSTLHSMDLSFQYSARAFALIRPYKELVSTANVATVDSRLAAVLLTLCYCYQDGFGTVIDVPMAEKFITLAFLLSNKLSSDAQYQILIELGLFYRRTGRPQRAQFYYQKVYKHPALKSGNKRTIALHAGIDYALCCLLTQDLKEIQAGQLQLKNCEEELEKINKDTTTSLTSHTDLIAVNARLIEVQIKYYIWLATHSSNLAEIEQYEKEMEQAIDRLAAPHFIRHIMNYLIKKASFDFSKIEAFLKKFPVLWDFPEIQFLFAHACLRAGKVQEAMRLFDLFSRSFPDRADSFFIGMNYLESDTKIDHETELTQPTWLDEKPSFNRLCSVLSHAETPIEEVLKSLKKYAFYYREHPEENSIFQQHVSKLPGILEFLHKRVPELNIFQIEELLWSLALLPLDHPVVSQLAKSALMHLLTLVSAHAILLEKMACLLPALVKINLGESTLHAFLSVFLSKCKVDDLSLKQCALIYFSLATAMAAFVKKPALSSESPATPSHLRREDFYSLVWGLRARLANDLEALLKESPIEANKIYMVDPYLRKMCDIPLEADDPFEILLQPFQEITPGTEEDHMSRLHQTVASQLKEMAFKIENEVYLKQARARVDMLTTYKEKPVIIEIVGPSHFKFTSDKTIRFTNPDKLRHQRLRQLDFGIVYVSYLEWAKVRRQPIPKIREFLVNKLEKAFEDTPVEELDLSGGLELEDQLSWRRRPPLDLPSSKRSSVLSSSPTSPAPLVVSGHSIFKPSAPLPPTSSSLSSSSSMSSTEGPSFSS